MQEAEDVREMPDDEIAETGEVVRAPTDEWTAAALAHASVLLTFVLGAAGGVGAPVGLAVSLAMYFGYHEKSRFVAFHALQSFVYQTAGLLVYVVVSAALGVSVTLAWNVSAWLAAVLVGFLLMPFALLLTLLMALVLVGAPIAWLGYGLYAAYQVYQGDNFHYWLIGERLEKEVNV